MADNQPEHKLFKEESLPELTNASYYAYLDSVERIEGRYFVRFDCIDILRANEVEITSETILDFPSVVIEISDETAEIDNLFGGQNLYDLESTWMIIKTELGQTQQVADQHFNFTSLSAGTQGNYGVTAITTPQDLGPLETDKIDEIVRATLLHESGVKDVTDFLDNLNLAVIDHVNVYDVGQGNCNGLVDQNNVVKAYFDLGGGCNANKFTYPVNIKACFCQNPPVILSHWDQDHIELALNEPYSWTLKWLVPKQKLSNTAYHLANRLIKNGNLICWNSTIVSPYNFQGNFISKCTGSINNKNNSGLALFVEYQPLEYVLLPGDARFGAIPFITTGRIIALVASHHGANGSVTGKKHLPPIAAGHKMIAYSYGQIGSTKNTHGHSHSGAEIKYSNRGWGPEKRAKNGHIALKRRPLNLITPCATAGTCTLQIKRGQHY
ncbi:MAG: hypothetical protein JSS82_14325 [Bacteroidetes bacterium]|nr:hypothetical protein [Bacteroidota bacterium]